MRPRDILAWRRVVGLTQIDAANLCGRSRFWILHIEDGTTPIPRWLNYLVAYTRVFKPVPPYSPAELAAKMMELRHQYGLTRDDLALWLGISTDKVSEIENGRACPIGVGFAVAWITLYGSRLPYPTSLLPVARVR